MIDGGWCGEDDVLLLDDQVFISHINSPSGVHRTADYLGGSCPLHQVVPAEVPNSPGKINVTITKVDDSTVAEAHRLRPLSGRGHFGNSNSNDERINEAAHDVLYGDDDDGMHAVLRHSSESVTNGGLSFEREEESGCEAADFKHAGFSVGILDVSISESDNPEEDSKKEPGQNVRESKDQKHHPPSDLHQGGKDVGHKQQPFLRNMAEHDVRAAFFTYVAVFVGSGSIFGLHGDFISAAHRRILSVMHLPEAAGNISKISYAKMQKQ